MLMAFTPTKWDYILYKNSNLNLAQSKTPFEKDRTSFMDIPLAYPVWSYELKKEQTTNILMKFMDC